MNVVKVEKAMTLKLNINYWKIDLVGKFYFKVYNVLKQF